MKREAAAICSLRPCYRAGLKEAGYAEDKAWTLLSSSSVIGLENKFPQLPSCCLSCAFFLTKQTSTKFSPLASLKPSQAVPGTKRDASPPLQERSKHCSAVHHLDLKDPFAQSQAWDCLLGQERREQNGL